MKVAINGFGRIGRAVVARALDRRGFEIVAVNDVAPAVILAHLLKYDSVHGILEATVSASKDALFVNGHEIKVFQQKDPALLPWKELEVNCVLECTGHFTQRKDAIKHLHAGATKVILSAPSNDADATIVIGVNERSYQPQRDHILSCGSCTTNAFALVASILDRAFTILNGTMTTIHAYTNDMRLLDAPHTDLRRARAACISMVPTSTGAAETIAKVLPQLQGKFASVAVRVPTPDVSLIDLTATVSKNVTVNDINALFEECSKLEFAGLLGFTREPLVSADFRGNSCSAVIDASLTQVVEDRTIKVFAWYDNEIGFAHRMVDLTELLFK